MPIQLNSFANSINLRRVALLYYDFYNKIAFKIVSLEHRHILNIDLYIKKVLLSVVEVDFGIYIFEELFEYKFETISVLLLKENSFHYTLFILDTDINLSAFAVHKGENGF